MAEKKKQSMMEKYGPVFVAYWTGAWAVTGVGVYVGMATMITPEQVLSTPTCAVIPNREHGAATRRSPPTWNPGGCRSQSSTQVGEPLPLPWW